MFSTLSSFLPSALQPTEDKRQQGDNSSKRASQLDPSPAQPDASATESNSQTVTPAESKPAEETAHKRKRNTHETFIVVRPPPAKSNHPLNLQVQLVPPQSRDRSLRRSVDLSAEGSTEDSNSLQRTASNRSDASAYSSVSSFSSVSSTASSRRMIIPLYNLQAHNVMTNTIVDAGTDAKVAKLTKRGLEVLGLAILEPLEVYGSHSSLTTPILYPNTAASMTSTSARTSLDSHRDHVPFRQGLGSESAERPTTPNSIISASSAGIDSTPTPVQTPFAAPVEAPAPTGAKKIFGRLFKKKDVPSPTSTPTPEAPAGHTFLRVPSKASAAGAQAKRASWAPQTTKAALATEGVSSTSGYGVPLPPGVTLQPAVLGIQAILSAPIVPPRGRPHSYAWVVRRWIKGAEDGLLTNVIGFMGNIGLGEDVRASRPEGQVEVQFIWSRGKSKSAGKRPDTATTSGEGAGDEMKRTQSSSSRRRSLAGDHPSMSSLGSSQAAKRKNRLSMASAHSVSTAAGEDSEVPASRGGDDDGDESDPEDSETPWTCTLIVRRVSPANMGGGGGPYAANSPTQSVESHAQQPIVRVKIATFSPTPHHPKVVALLKVPFPLPDVIVDQMNIQRRVVTPQGLARPSYDPETQTGLVLTAEEIKDIVSSTGLWLVVREGMGGVGKVSRKGDGWRIRA
ncbi:hypothetical protein PENSPDRAFT_646852 [Peniophora sp. CONT]|nr:hypothetical protein PENSPDRAFT_646852 [Peniophora sp. CONT]